MVTALKGNEVLRKNWRSRPDINWLRALERNTGVIWLKKDLSKLGEKAQVCGSKQ